MKTRIGISRDHSGSMRGIAHVAGKDYNSKIESIAAAAKETGQDTRVTVAECGYGSTSLARLVAMNVAPTELKPIDRYIADGNGTPLFDSVGLLIEAFENSPEALDPETSFLVMAITDGAENASNRYNSTTIARKIKALQDTDRWTFVFRVPRGHSRYLTSIGIPAGNILEWDQTEKGTVAAAQQDAEAFTQYFSARSMGTSFTKTFYADLSEVSSKDVEAKLEDVSQDVVIFPVTVKEDKVNIRDFVEGRQHGQPFLKGSGFYQFTKKEDNIQANKKILIRDKNTKSIYYGNAARQLLGLPLNKDVRVQPGKFGDFDVFVQSSSVNRKLIGGTDLIVWKDVGVHYKEGPSAR